MKFVELYGENNSENLLPSMIRRIVDTDNPEGVVLNMLQMTKEELEQYKEDHAQEWQSYLETYVPPEPSLWDNVMSFFGIGG